MKKLVYGVGINDLGYRTQVWEWVTENGGKRIRKLVFLCEYYAAWKSMLERCYSEKHLERYPSYIGTSVYSEWLYATEFRKWMEQQDWRGKSLDKDIIVPRNKLYSPDTCAFVLPATNSFVIASDASRGDYPVGVSLLKRAGKYQAQCGNLFTGEKEYLGLFSTPEEAHEAWRKRKHEIAQLVAARESDPRIVEALKKWYSFEEWYKRAKTTWWVDRTAERNSYAFAKTVFTPKGVQWIAGEWGKHQAEKELNCQVPALP